MSGKVPKSEDRPATARSSDAPRSHAPEHLPRFLSAFLDKLKRRNVGRVAILYIVVCYLILEPFEMFFHLLDLPAWTGRTVVFVMVLGFPAALLFAWIYEITPSGIKPSVEVDPSRSIARQTGRKLDRAIIAVLAVALTYFVVDKFWLSKRVAKISPTATVAPPRAAHASASPAIPARSVAVLPFVDMSEKKDQEYFSDGLSEELIDQLTRVPDLVVPARTSSFYFKGRQATIADIAHALGVSHILEGSVRKSGNNLRITAQLIRVDNGYHVWSQTYDRKLDDIFRIQDDITAAVVSSLKLSLLAAGQDDIRGTSNIEANDLYQQASFIYFQRAHGHHTQAVNLLHHAIALEPGFGRAWALLSRVRSFQVYEGVLPKSDEAGARTEALSAGNKAVDLAPTLAESHIALGIVFRDVDNDLQSADREFKQALALNPRSADALMQLSSDAGLVGNHDQRNQLGSKALAADPLNVATMKWNAFLAYLDEDYTRAESLYRQAHELSPENREVMWGLCDVLLFRGTPAAALAEWERVSYDDEDRWVGRAMLYPALGRQPEADAVLVLLEQSKQDSPWIMVQVYGFRGDLDKGFEWLDKQYRLDPTVLNTYLLDDPKLKSLRSDPRYAVLLKKLGLRG
jgi:adenylate cyclase